MTSGKLTATASLVLSAAQPAGGTASESTLPDLEAAVSKASQFALTFGTGSGQVNGIVCQERTLAAGASETLDLLAGGLADVLGATCNLQTLKFLQIDLLPDPTTGTTASGVRVGAAASNAHALWFADATDALDVLSGGPPLRMGSAAGKTVDGTHKNLKVLNLDGSNPATYRLTLAGVKV